VNISRPRTAFVPSRGDPNTAIWEKKKASRHQCWPFPAGLFIWAFSGRSELLQALDPASHVFMHGCAFPNQSLHLGLVYRAMVKGCFRQPR
jgi:hypothetical protein